MSDRVRDREPELGEILNLAEAALYLGVSTKTLQKVLRAGDVPARKIGREWKFSRPALREWVGSGRSREFLDASDSRDLESERTPSSKDRSASVRRSTRAKRVQRAELSAEED